MDKIEQDRAEEGETSPEESNSNLEKEIAAGEWMRLREFRTYRARTRQGRILAVYQALSNRLDQLVKVFYSLARENRSLAEAEKLLTEINCLKKVRETLLRCLTWEKRESPPELPEEVAEVVG
jgi:hypothetical protein